MNHWSSLFYDLSSGSVCVYSCSVSTVIRDQENFPTTLYDLNTLYLWNELINLEILTQGNVSRLTNEHTYYLGVLSLLF